MRYNFQVKAQPGERHLLLVEFQENQEYKLVAVSLNQSPEKLGDKLLKHMESSLSRITPPTTEELLELEKEV